MFNSTAIMAWAELTFAPVETVVLTFPESLLMYSQAVEGVWTPTSDLSVQLVIGVTWAMEEV